MPTINEILFGEDSRKEREQQAWLRQMLEGTKNTGGSIMDRGLENVYSQLLPFLANQGVGAEQMRQLFSGIQNDIMNPANANNANTFFTENNPFTRGMTPEMRDQISRQTGLGNVQGDMGNLANQVFSGGGWSNQSQNVFDQLDQFRNPSGANNQMRDLAGQVIAGGGANPYSNFTVDQGTASLNRGGRTDQSAALQNYGERGLQSGGQTPWDMLALDAAKQGLATQGFNQNSNSLSGTGQGLLSSQGKSGDNSFLNSRGKEILASNPLLSMEEVTNRAADKAGNLFASNSRQNYEQAMKRGGGPAVRSGLQNFAVAEGEDEQLRAVGDAITNARGQQQGLQLQNFGQGKDLMSEGLQNELQKLLAGGNLTGQGEQAALARMLGLTSLGNNSSDRALNAQQLYSQMMNQSGQLANQNMATLGGLGMEGLNAANNKLNSGINLFNSTNGADLQALQQYMQNLGQQNQYALGAGGLANNSYNGANNAFGSAFGQNLAGGQFGQAQLNDQYNAFGKNLDRGMNNANQGAQNVIGGVNQANDIFKTGANMFLGASTGQTPLVQQTGQGGGLVGTLVGGLASGAGRGIADLINRIPGGNSTGSGS
jgi:hypothetical protein